MPGAAAERGAVRWAADCDAIAEALAGVRFDSGLHEAGVS
jgi:hypothetical protein